MNCKIDPQLEGSRVAIETKFMIVEGLVRNVSSNGSKLSLINPVVVSSDAVLPALYHVFAKDISSSK